MESIDLGTLDGTANIEIIKPETQNGPKMRLRKKGYPAEDNYGPRGDFLIIIQIALTRGQGEKKKRLITKLAFLRK